MTAVRVPRAIRSTLRRVHRVWWLNIAITGGALAPTDPVGGFPAIPQPPIPWGLLAIAIAVCERWPVDLEFQRSKHSFSLTDIPIVLGLIFATGADAMCGLMLGTAIALLGRRLPPIKFVFNLAQFLFAVGLGAVVIHLLAGSDPSFGPRVWIGALLGLQAGGIVTVLLLAAVIWIADGRISLVELRQMFGMDLFVTAANTSLALIAAMIVVSDPAGLPVLLVPVLIGFAGYRAYVREHERHKKVEFLYQANRSLAESPEVAVAVEGLLERAREAFRAEHAEVIFFGPDDTPPLRTRLGVGDDRASLEPVDARAAADLRSLAEHGPVAFARPLPGPVRTLAGERELRNAMAAVLRGKDRVIGTILLANRAGLTRGFGDDDLALFETLAANASPALQFARLEQAVIEPRDPQPRLPHQAYHDPLPGLANRALFTQEVPAAVQAGDAAVLFIDLDDFKGVNDTLGHAVGDQLLSAVAARITRAAREQDLVARLGGDEFAVLVRAGDDVEQEAIRTARDVISTFEAPVSIEGRLLSAHLSVGVATCHHSGRTSADLLRDADVAMYEAKAAGKGR